MAEGKILNALDKILDKLRAAGAQCELVASAPKPVLLIEWKDKWLEVKFQTAILFLSIALGELLFGSKTCSIVRCVGIDRLAVILQQGCDVQPKDAVLWIDKSPSKALEYGGEAKVMMVFDIRRTQPSHLEVESNIDQDKLNELRAVYQTVVSTDSSYWFSRLPENDKRVGSPYEVEHGRWIPKNPLDALAGLVVLGRNFAEMRASVESSIAACQHPKWRL